MNSFPACYLLSTARACSLVSLYNLGLGFRVQGLGCTCANRMFYDSMIPKVIAASSVVVDHAALGVKLRSVHAQLPAL